MLGVLANSYLRFIDNAVINSEVTSMKRACRIALLMPYDVSFCRDVLRGVRAYAIGKQQWVFRHGLPQKEIIRPLQDWKPVGIIAHLVVPEVARAIARMRKPAVDTAFTLPKLPDTLDRCGQRCCGFHGSGTFFRARLY